MCTCVGYLHSAWSACPSVACRLAAVGAEPAGGRSSDSAAECLAGDWKGRNAPLD